MGNTVVSGGSIALPPALLRQLPIQQQTTPLTEEQKQHMQDYPFLSVMGCLDASRVKSTMICMSNTDGLVLCKLFASRTSRDQSLDLKQFQALKLFHKAILSCDVHPHVCPDERLLSSDRSTIFVRRFFSTTVADRLHNRPFATPSQLLWMSFQALCAVTQLHSVGFLHGDIKTENFALMSYMHLMLVDAAPWKDVPLKLLDMRAFNLLFENPKRGRCYIAPERFWDKQDDRKNLGSLRSRQSMDMFSLACCLAEIFLEGSDVVDLLQLLQLRESIDLSDVTSPQANKEDSPHPRNRIYNANVTGGQQYQQRHARSRSKHLIGQLSVGIDTSRCCHVPPHMARLLQGISCVRIRQLLIQGSLLQPPHLRLVSHKALSVWSRYVFPPCFASYLLCLFTVFLHPAYQQADMRILLLREYIHHFILAILEKRKPDVLRSRKLLEKDSTTHGFGDGPCLASPTPSDNPKQPVERKVPSYGSGRNIYCDAYGSTEACEAEILAVIDNAVNCQATVVDPLTAHQCVLNLTISLPHDSTVAADILEAWAHRELRAGDEAAANFLSTSSPVQCESASAAEEAALASEAGAAAAASASTAGAIPHPKLTLRKTRAFGQCLLTLWENCYRSVVEDRQPVLQVLQELEHAKNEMYDDLFADAGDTRDVFGCNMKEYDSDQQQPPPVVLSHSAAEAPPIYPALHMIELLLQNPLSSLPSIANSEIRSPGDLDDSIWGVEPVTTIEDVASENCLDDGVAADTECEQCLRSGQVILLSDVIGFALQHTSSPRVRVCGVSLLQFLSTFASLDVLLESIIPFLIKHLVDHVSTVRARAVQALTVAMLHLRKSLVHQLECRWASERCPYCDNRCVRSGRGCNFPQKHRFCSESAEFSTKNTGESAQNDVATLFCGFILPPLRHMALSDADAAVRVAVSGQLPLLLLSVRSCLEAQTAWNIRKREVLGIDRSAPSVSDQILQPTTERSTEKKRSKCVEGSFSERPAVEASVIKKEVDSAVGRITTPADPGTRIGHSRSEAPSSIMPSSTAPYRQSQQRYKFRDDRQQRGRSEVERSETEQRVQSLRNSVREFLQLLLTGPYSAQRMVFLGSVHYLAEFLGKQEAQNFLLPFLIMQLNDPSPQMRAVVIRALGQLGIYAGLGATEDCILPCCEQCFYDAHEEVVLAGFMAVEQLAADRMLPGTSRFVMHLLQKCIVPLALFPSSLVRTAFYHLLLVLQHCWGEVQTFAILIPLLRPIIRRNAPLILDVRQIPCVLREPLSSTILQYLQQSGYLPLLPHIHSTAAVKIAKAVRGQLRAVRNTPVERRSFIKTDVNEMSDWDGASNSDNSSLFGSSTDSDDQDLDWFRSEDDGGDDERCWDAWKLILPEGGCRHGGSESRRTVGMPNVEQTRTPMDSSLHFQPIEYLLYAMTPRDRYALLFLLPILQARYVSSSKTDLATSRQITCQSEIQPGGKGLPLLSAVGTMDRRRSLGGTGIDWVPSIRGMVTRDGCSDALRTQKASSVRERELPRCCLVLTEEAGNVLTATGPTQLSGVHTIPAVRMSALVPNLPLLPRIRLLGVLHEILLPYAIYWIRNQQHHLVEYCSIMKDLCRQYGRASQRSGDVCTLPCDILGRTVVDICTDETQTWLREFWTKMCSVSREMATAVSRSSTVSLRLASEACSKSVAASIMRYHCGLRQQPSATEALLGPSGACKASSPSFVVMSGGWPLVPPRYFLTLVNEAARAATAAALCTNLEQNLRVAAARTFMSDFCPFGSISQLQRDQMVKFTSFPLMALTGSVQVLMHFNMNKPSETTVYAPSPPTTSSAIMYNDASQRPVPHLPSCLQHDWRCAALGLPRRPALELGRLQRNDGTFLNLYTFQTPNIDSSTLLVSLRDWGGRHSKKNSQRRLLSSGSRHNHVDTNSTALYSAGTCFDDSSDFSLPQTQNSTWPIAGTITSRPVSGRKLSSSPRCREIPSSKVQYGARANSPAAVNAGGDSTSAHTRTAQPNLSQWAPVGEWARSLMDLEALCTRGGGTISLGATDDGRLMMAAVLGCKGGEIRSWNAADLLCDTRIPLAGLWRIPKELSATATCVIQNTTTIAVGTSDGGCHLLRLDGFGEYNSCWKNAISGAAAYLRPPRLQPAALQSRPEMVMEMLLQEKYGKGKWQGGGWHNDIDPGYTNSSGTAREAMYLSRLLCPLVTADEVVSVSGGRFRMNLVAAASATAAAAAEEMGVSCICHGDTSLEQLLLYSLHNGLLGGWDLRMSSSLFAFHLPPWLGYPTAQAIGDDSRWEVIGTSAGVLVIFDLRMALPVHAWMLSPPCSILKLVRCNFDSDIISRMPQNCGTESARPMTCRMLALLDETSAFPVLLLDMQAGRVVNSYSSSCYANAMMVPKHSPTSTCPSTPWLEELPLSWLCAAPPPFGSLLQGRLYERRSRVPRKQPSPYATHAPRCLWVAPALRGPTTYFLTGGNDRCVRYWYLSDHAFDPAVNLTAESSRQHHSIPPEEEAGFQIWPTENTSAEQSLDGDRWREDSTQLNSYVVISPETSCFGRNGSRPTYTCIDIDGCCVYQELCTRCHAKSEYWADQLRNADLPFGRRSEVKTTGVSGDSSKHSDSYDPCNGASQVRFGRLGGPATVGGSRKCCCNSVSRRVVGHSGWSDSWDDNARSQVPDFDGVRFGPSPQHRDSIVSITALGQDEILLVTAGKDGVVKIWR